MARPIDPTDPPEPGDPPTDTGTQLAAIVSTTTISFTADQITAAGGPWAAFTVRVTAINTNGSSAPVEVDYPA